MIAVQNGMVPEDIEDVVRAEVGIFVGGDTTWKLRSLPEWCRFAKRTGIPVHVGRVNSCRRVTYCRVMGADSFDGSSAKWVLDIDLLERARHEPLIQEVCVHAQALGPSWSRPPG